ncbi:hypothetical protein G5T42_05530 [Microbacterium sp. 4R-513]|uniref:hypothetical protein n=1 Tax=Microbacterium sp. 4R-513 TaxID=2567934 RepID=UPI0013E0F985|nr:hypothetical protein [Microbacterium sp. 4R-513]QIG39018.1 hypothetical protein G5T42_05530 [Microbacterium sp. 4R-513]
MNAIWTTTATGSGLLPEARHRLSAVMGALGGLQAETAWECRAAEEYRAALERLIGHVRELCEVSRDVECDLRSAWHRAASAGAW